MNNVWTTLFTEQCYFVFQLVLQCSIFAKYTVIVLIRLFTEYDGETVYNWITDVPFDTPALQYAHSEPSSNRHF